MTVDPGHFHAGLVHGEVYEGVDPVVHVYAPAGPELDRHVAMVEGFNSRAARPTSWELVLHTGDDFLERMVEERPGNVMVAAGNNARKIDYVRRAVDAGIHVLADKPMIIRPEDFDVLRLTLETADRTGVVVNDIMTERHEATSILQAALAHDPDVFGALVPGTPDDPAITKESVHFLSKTVAGSQLVRPAWFLDAAQQGEAIVDVSTHLVDLVLWQAFPGTPISYEDPADGVRVLEAETWDTGLTPAWFERITQTDAYPDFLWPDVTADSVLHVAANGAFTFSVRGIVARVSVRWGIENPGGGDTHFSRIRGTRADLVIRQDSARGYVPTLYVEPARGEEEAVGRALRASLGRLADEWPGLGFRASDSGLEVVIPDSLREGHEAHFARVMRGFLADLGAGGLPAWERANLLTKYYVTTGAYAIAHEGRGG
jgi:predicted dehydrogenase